MMTKINKKTNKIIAFAVICVLAMATFVGCADKKSDEKPELVGAGDFECIVNEPVDLLRRVSALDREDGDITPQMTIVISPAVPVNNGVVVFPSRGRIHGDLFGDRQRRKHDHRRNLRDRVRAQAV